MGCGSSQEEKGDKNKKQQQQQSNDSKTKEAPPATKQEDKKEPEAKYEENKQEKNENTEPEKSEVKAESNEASPAEPANPEEYKDELLEACSDEGDLEKVQELCKKFPGCVNHRYEDGGFTCLIVAAQGGHVDIVKEILSHNREGKDYVNVAEEDAGDTALNASTHNCHHEVGALLIAAGADVNKGNNDGAFPLNNVAEYGSVEYTKLLLEHGADIAAASQSEEGGPTALHSAAEGGNVDVLKLIIDKKGEVDINTKDPSGMTPLSFACRRGNDSAAKVLIENGADPLPAEEDAGMTCLHLACIRMPEEDSTIEKQRIEIVKTILEKGIDVNIKKESEEEDEQKTPLCIACESQNFLLAKFLVEEKKASGDESVLSVLEEQPEEEEPGIDYTAQAWLLDALKK